VPNLVSFQHSAGGKRWHILGVLYMSPNIRVNDLCVTMLPLRQHHPRLPCIATGIVIATSPLLLPHHVIRGQTIIDTIHFMVGLNDIGQHFCQCCAFCDLCTWRQYWDNRWIRSKCDCVLSDAARKHFSWVHIADPRNFNYDHFALYLSITTVLKGHTYIDIVFATVKHILITNIVPQCLAFATLILIPKTDGGRSPGY
jgi:hypothetical protein